MTPNNQRVSRLLSKALRHDPGCIGIQLDKEGWVTVAELLKALQRTNPSFTLYDLKEIVAENDKQRFAFDDNIDCTKIRANQGHSIREIEVPYKEQQPPEFLYHGTATKFYDSIKKTGITKQNRNHVHLSDNIKTAESVGKRHGKCLILRIDSMLMFLHGYKWFKSDNGVWLTDEIPMKYIKIHQYIEEQYYIHSGDYVGNAMLWWGLNSVGYTTDLDKAHKFCLDEAKAILNNKKGDVAYSVDYINRRISKTVDMQNISPADCLK